VRDRRHLPEAVVRRIAIVGLPNTGKSQLYNELTGQYTLVANYPLTTVEPKSGPMSYRGNRYQIIDTPGLHSAYIHSEEEMAVRELLFGDPPDGLVQCVDANRLKQSLLLTLDLLALGLPLVLCLTAVEETERQGLRIDARRLARRLGVELVEHNAALNRGVEEIKAAMARMRPAEWKPAYGEQVERALARLQEALPASVHFPRLKALLLLDRDPQVAQELRAEGGVTPELRERVRRLRRESRAGWSRLLGRKRAQLVEGIVAEATTREPGTGGRAATAVARLCRHPLFGLPILAGIVAVLYLLVVRVAGLIQSLLTSWVVVPVVRAVGQAVPAGFWQELLIGDFGLLTLGIFNALVTVLPILSVFFLVLGLLEDIGYLPNLVVLTQRLLKGIGLSGRSVLSLVLGFGCKTMATLTVRGIPSRKERLITVYLIAFAIPCSAQLGISMAILGRVGLPAFLIAFAFLALVEVAAGWVLHRLLPEEVQGDFIQELPPIRVPRPGAVLKKTAYRLYWFLKEALPIFLVAAAALFLADRSGLLGLLQRGLKPVVVGWLGLPLNMVEVLILTMARHEAAAGLIYRLVNQGALSYIQSIVAVTITIMFVPCFANIVAMCRQVGVRAGVLITLAINLSSFLLAGALNWLLLLLRVG
jgi:ferrous iron transport protein B